MFVDLLTSIAWLFWIAIMVAGLAMTGRDTYKRIRVRKIANETPLSRFFRVVFQQGRVADESMRCQASCSASKQEIVEAIKELIQFRRPCLQYPLNSYWWQLNNFDCRTGEISAILRYPENERGSFKKNAIELVWQVHENYAGCHDVCLDWYQLYPWQTRYKHNVLLSMVAYTEERIKRLNNPELELSSQKAVVHEAATSYLPAGLISELKAQAQSTAWPTAQDYNEAIQNPAICFIDEELRAGLPELNSLGIPRAASGAFASVYRISCGRRDLAVRCFLNPVRDQEIRYGILAKHLASESTKAIVDFSFLKDGIKIRGKEFPILKMEWIEGPALHTYVEKHVKSRSRMMAVRESFSSMVKELRQARIAHGDLQHGNIIVKADLCSEKATEEASVELILVDYDGVFVPELFRFHSAELGHPNYQHPKRAGKHFGLFLDNFAGWLIDTTLLCLIEDPSLWQKFEGGDECLLFRRSDLLRPEQSELLIYLQNHPSLAIRESIAFFLSLLKKELEEIPFL